MQEVNIEFLKEEEVQELSDVILEVFEEFVAGDFLEEGITLFREFISPLSLKEREEKGIAFTLVAKYQGKIIGTISFKGKDHITLFYVSKAYHRKGIGKSLFAKALDKILISDDRQVKKITVNASTNSVEVYKSLGFVPQGTGEPQQTNGIVYLAMEMLMQ